jgi:hypothetical protein
MTDGQGTGRGDTEATVLEPYIEGANSGEIRDIDESWRPVGLMGDEERAGGSQQLRLGRSIGDARA